MAKKNSDENSKSNKSKGSPKPKGYAASDSVKFFQSFLKDSKKASTKTVEQLIKERLDSKKRESKDTEYLKEIAQQMASVNRDIQDALAENRNKKFVEDTKNLDPLFEEMFKNLDDLSVLFDRFMDPNDKLNREDAKRMQDLLDKDQEIVEQINKKREEDKGFNERLLSIEKDTKEKVAKQGVAFEEEAYLTKKFRKTEKEIWSDVSDNIGVLSTDLTKDLSESILVGIGGPLGGFINAIRKTALAPAWEKFKETEYGKEKIDKVKGLFNSKDEEIKESATSKVKSDDGLAGLERSVDELINPSQSDVKKRVVKENKVKSSQREPVYKVINSLKDVTVKIGDKASISLKDIKDAIDASFSQVKNVSEGTVKQLALVEKLNEITQEERKEIISSGKDQVSKLDRLVDDNDYLIAKARLEEKPILDNLRQQSLVWGQEKIFREDTRLWYEKVLDKLDKEGEGGGLLEGLGAGAMGAGLMTALEGIASALVPLLVPVAIAVAVPLLLDKYLEYDEKENEKEWEKIKKESADARAKDNSVDWDKLNKSVEGLNKTQEEKDLEERKKALSKPEVEQAVKNFNKEEAKRVGDKGYGLGSGNEKRVTSASVSAKEINKGVQHGAERDLTPEVDAATAKDTQKNIEKEKELQQEYQKDREEDLKALEKNAIFKKKDIDKIRETNASIREKVFGMPAESGKEGNSKDEQGDKTIRKVEEDLKALEKNAIFKKKDIDKIRETNASIREKVFGMPAESGKEGNSKDEQGDKTIRKVEEDLRRMKEEEREKEMERTANKSESRNETRGSTAMNPIKVKRENQIPMNSIMLHDDNTLLILSNSGQV